AHFRVQMKLHPFFRVIVRAPPRRRFRDGRGVDDQFLGKAIDLGPAPYFHPLPLFHGGLGVGLAADEGLDGDGVGLVRDVEGEQLPAPDLPRLARQHFAFDDDLPARLPHVPQRRGLAVNALHQQGRPGPAVAPPPAFPARGRRDGNAVGGLLEDEVHVLVFVQLLQGRRLLRRRRFFGPVRRRRLPGRRRHGRGRGRRRVVPGGRRHVRFRPLGLPLKDEGHPVHAGDGLQQPLLQLPQRLVRDGPRTGQHHTPRPADRVHLHPLQRRRAHRGGFVLGQARQHFAQRVGLFRLNDVYAHWCTSLSGQ